MACARRAIERQAVAAAVRRLLDDARGGRGGALVVVGAAGLGKTTVLESAVDVAGRRFARRRGTGGDVVEASLPFGLIQPTCRSRLGILRRVREAAVWTLLVAFDDLHRADPDSLLAPSTCCGSPLS